MEQTYQVTIGFAAAAAQAIRIVQANQRQMLGDDRDPIHPGGPQDARRYANSLLHGSEKQFYDLFRMHKETFRNLLLWLQTNAGLQGNRYQTADQKLMVVLYILGHAANQRTTAYKFRVSQSSVSRTMKTVLPMLVSLHKAFVRLPEDEWLDPIIELDPKVNAFNGCIGAIDGTHIAAFIPLEKQLRWRDRKGNITQNVFAAVKQDYSFSYVLAGAEGSMSDSTLCQQAFSRSFHVPAGRYYVADAGFGVRDGIVIPFPGVRYHLQDWRNAANPPETKKELYNLRHARIRTVVEQAFGLVKRKWRIIRNASSEYNIDKQVEIVYAVTVTGP